VDHIGTSTAGDIASSGAGETDLQHWGGSMPVKEDDRAQFEAFGDLGFDGQDREILVGLSYEETEWYLDVLERQRSGESVTEAEIDWKSVLIDRHNAARLKLTEAAYEVRIRAHWARENWVRSNPRSTNIPPGAGATARRFRARRETA
jgi:hypothetical protein